MKTTTKLGAIGGALLSASLFVGQSAYAATCADIGVAAGMNGTLQDLIDAGSCDDQDKRYAYVGQSGSPSLNDVLLDISTIAITPTFDLHVLKLSAPAANPYPFAGLYTLDYSMEIIDPDPNRVFWQLAIDSDVPGNVSTVSIRKDIYSDAGYTNLVASVISNAGNPGGPVDIPGDLRKIWINETFNVGGTTSTPPGILLSTTNIYTQRVVYVPEPSVLALFGLGLAGIGFGARARKA